MSGFFSIIVAMTEKGVIGVNGTLPWHLPSDLKRFKEITMGKTIIMGRKTFESIGRPLPGRRNIVVTRNPKWRAEGVEVITDLDAILRKVPAPGENFIIGGADLFREALPYTEKLYVTWVLSDIKGDTYFPEWSTRDFLAKKIGEFQEPLPHRYVDYTRISSL